MSGAAIEKSRTWNVGDACVAGARAVRARRLRAKRLALQFGIAASRALPSTLPAFVAALLFVLVMWVWSPLRTAFEFDPDEGSNLIKAALVEHGDALYASVRSDQPPLYTHLLRAWMSRFGWTVESARMLSVLFGALVVFAGFELARRSAGWLAGIVCVALLACVPTFPRVSMAVMIGMPSLALALASLWCLACWCARARPAWLVCAGALLGLSLSVKLFTALLVPLFAGCIVMHAVQNRAGARISIARALVWFGTGLLIVLLTQDWPHGLRQNLIDGHVDARELFADDPVWAGARRVRHTLHEDVELHLLALLGAWRVLRGPTPVTLTLALWYAIGVGIIFTHVPLWYHHTLYATIPGALLAALALDPRYWFASATRARAAFKVAALAAACALVIAVARGSKVPMHWLRNSTTPDKVLAIVREHAHASPTLVGARQMYAFRAGLLVPPDLAVTSLKMFARGDITGKTVMADVDACAPALIMLTDRWPKSVCADVRAAIADRYRRLPVRDVDFEHELYLRNDLNE